MLKGALNTSSVTGTRLSSSTSSDLPGSNIERMHYLRQNQDLSRLCSLKSVQVRQIEAKLSKLERENLGMKMALRETEKELTRKERLAAVPASTSSAFQDHTDVDTTQMQDRSQQSHECQWLAARCMASRDDDRQAKLDVNWGDEYNEQLPQSKGSSRYPLSQSPFESKAFLMSKLSRVHAIYKSEREALRTMMASFNSTTRFYKDLLKQLEMHTLSAGRHSRDQESEDDIGVDRSSHKQRHQRQQLGCTSILTDIDMGRSLHSSLLEKNGDTSFKSPYRSASTSFKGWPNHSTASNSPSPSPFFDTSRLVRKREREHNRSQSVPLQSLCVHRTNGSLSFRSEVPRSGLEQALMKDTDLNERLDGPEPVPVAIPCTARPSPKFPSANSTLPKINELAPLEITKSSGQPGPVTFLRSQPSLSAELLESVKTSHPAEHAESNATPTATHSMALNLKLAPQVPRSPISISRRKDEFHNKRRLLNARHTADAFDDTAQDTIPGNERLKAIALSKALLAKFVSHTSTSTVTDAATSAPSSNVRAIQPTATNNGDDSNTHQDGDNWMDEDGEEDGNGKFESSDKSGTGRGTSLEYSGGDISRKTSSISHAIHAGHGGTGVVHRRPVISKKRLRATPSPMIKSRSAITAQRLKAMTPQHLLRRMNKSVLGVSKAPALPKAIVRGTTAFGNFPAVLAPPSSPEQPQSSSSAQSPRASVSADHGEDIRLMPPPPTPAVRTFKQHHQVPKQCKRNRDISLDVAGKRLKQASSQSDGEGANFQGEELQDVKSSKRKGATSILYKLPNLRE
ncbi:hypothetical protein BGX28_001927 [Mortierella sp. GBA30]|nr:hypothetical protein BGX28_001927 [Mortierella sp. GBA30]